MQFAATRRTLAAVFLLLQRFCRLCSSQGALRRVAASALCTLSVSTLACACDDQAESLPEVAGDAPDRFGVKLSERAAFDLLVDGSGVTLFWGEPVENGGRILQQRLDQRGHALDAPTPVLPDLDGEARVLELMAASTSDGRALVWRETIGAAARAQATWLRDGQRAQRLDFGPATDLPGRGHVAISAGFGEVIALTRGPREACPEGHCGPFLFHRFGDPQGDRRGSPLSVPAPCHGVSTALVHTGPRWHYGLCTQRPMRTTVFTIQPKPEYARALELLDGCSLRGTLVRDTALGPSGLIVGECRAGRRVAFIPEDDVPPLELDIGEPQARCSKDQLQVVGKHGFIQTFDTPHDHVEALLPSRLSPPSSRAAWTGKTLLIATASEAESVLSLKAYACQHELLLPVSAADDRDPPP